MNLWQGWKKAMENDIIDSFCYWPNFRPIFLQEIEGFTFVKGQVLKSFLGISAIDELQKRFGNFRVVIFE